MKCPQLKADKYLISTEEDGISEQWGVYLYEHLRKRTNDTSAVLLQSDNAKINIKKEENIKNIHLELASDLKFDYIIEHIPNHLHLRIRNKRIAVWIIYQLIERMAMEDDRFHAEDLPPAIIDFTAKGRNFDFEYREPYFTPNLEPDYSPILGANNVETDWGIWGHNLTKIIKGKEDSDIFALVKGKRNNKQFCFSSEEVFKQIEKYIIDNFGVGNNEYRMKFMIAPADNGMVCTCSSCIEAGNTNTNAIPAIQKLIVRLSGRFPDHLFYTSAYSSTLFPPEYGLPENSGVFLSTIALPKGIAHMENQPEINNFLQLMNEWKQTTSNIYLWDYAANFDDYLTPLPILLSLQAQLQFYKKQGIKGVFLNASGYDYSPFDDAKTFVASALMINASANVEQLLLDFFRKNYPVNHKLMAEYYIDLEKSYFTKNKPYNIYGGMRENQQTYFEADKFIKFYNALPFAILNAKGEESAKLKQLFTALTYTRLQLAYTQGTNKWGYAQKEGNKLSIKPEVYQWLSELGKHTTYDNLKNYKETDGNLSEYIAQWQHIIKANYFENILIGKPIELLSTPNKGFEKTDLLNNGTAGFATDYHQGWYLCDAKEFRVKFSADDLEKGKKMKFRFLQTERHHMAPPAEILLLIDGERVENLQIIKQIDTNEIGFQTVTYSMPVDFRNAQSIELKFICPKGKNTLAIDEIQLLR